MSEEALRSMQEMLECLMEDRRKREEEITAERTRQEEARVAREREVKEQMDSMRENMERLMRVVESSKAKETGEPSGKLNVKLVPLAERDDIEAYLVTFEQIMAAHKVDKDSWAHYLAPQLSGKAQLAFAALPTEDSGSYKAIKAAILKRYDINDEAYRRRFRSARRNGEETNRELAVRLMDLQKKWLKQCSSTDEVHEMIGIEQFLNTLPSEKRVWVYERKPKTCVHAGELADEYDQIRRQGPEVVPRRPRDQGRSERENPRKEMGEGSTPRGQGIRRTGQNRSEVQCYNCYNYGYVRRDCPEKMSLTLGDGVADKEPAMNAFCHSEELGGRMATQEGTGVCRRGLVEGELVRDIVLDTGCSRTMVHRELVPLENILEQKAAIRCAHGDTVLYPLVDLELEIGGEPIRVEAAVSEMLPVSVLLGTDVLELSTLLVEWTPRGNGGENQHVLQKQRKGIGSELGHEIPLVGKRGRGKMKLKTRGFYWSTLCRDEEEFYKSWIVCRSNPTFQLLTELYSHTPLLWSTMQGLARGMLMVFSSLKSRQTSLPLEKEGGV